MGGGHTKISSQQMHMRRSSQVTVAPVRQEQTISIDYLLGKGGFSTVHHGKEMKTNKEIAVKRIEITKMFEAEGNHEAAAQELEAIFTELNAFKRIQRHSFIVNLHSAFHLNVNCYFVMDCLHGGDLRRYLRLHGSLSEQCAVYIVGCIGSALHHIHSRGVIHRDVKPENIGLDLNGRPYLTDFGISVVSSPENPLPLCESSSGTLAYLAPEVLSPSHCHSYQSDFWSLGVMGFELFFGYRPFSRHCPTASIEFVSNQYGWMWDQLKTTDHDALKPCAVMDFETLRPPQLDGDGSPHSQSLVVPIPDSKYSSFADREMTLVSKEYKSLLRGLMDVRIPHRLGSATRFSEFSEHKCFFHHGYFPSELDLIASPLPPVSTPRCHSEINTPLRPLDSCTTISTEFPSLPSSIRTKLSEFSYCAAIDSSSPSQLKNWPLTPTKRSQLTSSAGLSLTRVHSSLASN